MSPQNEGRQSGQDDARQQPIDPQRPWQSGRQGGGSNYGHASRGPEPDKTEQAGQDQPGSTDGQGSNHGSGSNLARSLAGSGNGAIPPDNDRSDNDRPDRGRSNSDGLPGKLASSPGQ